MFLLRGFEFRHETVRDWEERFASLFAQQLRAKRQGKAGKSDMIVIPGRSQKCWNRKYNIESVTASPTASNKTIAVSNNVTIPC